MNTLRIIFIIIAAMNIGINLYRATVLNGDKAANINAICGWICAIIYACK